jgi:hypothetical protein
MGAVTERSEVNAMVTAKDEVREALERLTDEEAAEMLALIRTIERRREKERLYRHLAQYSTFRVPDSADREFRRVEPAPVTGRPASELLIEDRR